MDIEVSSLEKCYRAFCLDVPELYIARGEAVGLVGNNGAGKTTFLRLLLDLIEADSGEIRIGETDITRDVTWKKKAGSYLDESFLIDFLTAEEYFDFVGSVYDLPRDSFWDTIEGYADFLGGDVLGHRSRFMRDLSTGNRKKVGIVGALAVRPDLLILDEPFANLDPGSQIRLKQMLRKLHREHETTMIISSHDLVHVTEVCKRTVVLNGGEVELDLETSEATLHELEAYFAQQQAIE